ncbi:hypothetical protein OIE66_37060 [Nonomuraea sp. NBC_01738]|uniref:hypothetical protein n=1 Tax=Nonomuraea sp. NBC_01738 TaxID=2976003 RepID=UPI002E15CC62|nr:hypothetical protein OIE66_37060 [Nonomuraea sp. NBC_01738]
MYPSKIFTTVATIGATAALTILPYGVANAQSPGYVFVGTTVYPKSPAEFEPNGDRLTVWDYSPGNGWQTRAAVQKWNSGREQWEQIFACTANATTQDPKSCSQDIPEGTLVRVRIWEYKGTSTRGNNYSSQTHA